jgi:hypothetical protein
VRVLLGRAAGVLVQGKVEAACPAIRALLDAARIESEFERANGRVESAGALVHRRERLPRDEAVTKR